MRKSLINFLTFIALLTFPWIVFSQTMTNLPPGAKQAQRIKRTLSLPLVPTNFKVEDAGRCEVAFNPKLRKYIEPTLETCDSYIRELSEQLGFESLPSESVKIRITTNAADMKALSPPEAPPPQWADAVAYPQLGLIVISMVGGSGVSRPSLEVVIKHELSHLLLRRAAGIGHLPRWFVEGVAIVQSGEASLARLKVLYGAILRGKLLPLREINRQYLKEEWKVTLAYAQAPELVAELVNRHGGWGPVRQLVKKVSTGIHFNDAFNSVYYEKPEIFAFKWRMKMKKRLNFVPILTGSATLWTAMAVLLIWGYVRKRDENKKRLAQMGQEEDEYDEALDSILDALDKSSEKDDGPTIN